MKKSRILAGLVSAVSALSLMASMTANAAQLIQNGKDTLDEFEASLSPVADSSIVDLSADETAYHGENWCPFIREFNLREAGYDSDYTIVTKYGESIYIKTPKTDDDMIFMTLKMNPDEYQEAVDSVNDNFSGIFAKMSCINTLEEPTVEFVIKFNGNDHSANLEKAKNIADYIFANYSVENMTGNFGSYKYEAIGFDYDHWVKKTDKEEDIIPHEEFISMFNDFCAENDIDATIDTNSELVRAFDFLSRRKGIEEPQIFDAYHIDFDFHDIEKTEAITKFMQSYGYSCSGTRTRVFEVAPGSYSFMPDDYNLSTVSADTAEVLAPEAETLLGDANCDGKVDISDAVLVLQYLANPEKYPITAQGLINADIVGNDGVTALDALQIQMMEAGSIS